jgi:hypothetical protein
MAKRNDSESAKNIKDERPKRIWYRATAVLAAIELLAVVFYQMFLGNDDTNENRNIFNAIKKSFQEAIAYPGMLETDMTDQDLLIPSETDECLDKPKVDVPYDIEEEKNTQKNVDEGHSPWRLDPIFVAQVFVSLKISPEGIEGEYPIRYEDLKIVKNDGIRAVVKVLDKSSPVSRVYLERLVRQDSTGIWTVVGYDPAQ